MTAIIPLAAVPYQEVAVLLGNQSSTVTVRQTEHGLFLSLAVNNAPIIDGVVCENMNRIVRSAYLGFEGDLAFFDSQGASDPEYSGLGARYQLHYLTPEEY